jgi:GcrA cell cycle regulator
MSDNDPIGDPDVVNYMKPPPVWTPERTELLKKLWDLGLSAQKCADRLGPDISRNAVIGKVNRLKLPKRWKPEPKRKPEPRPAPPDAPDLPPRPVMPGQPGMHKVKISPRTGMAASYAKPEPVPHEIVEQPEGTVLLQHLRPFHCRYPVAEISPRVYAYCPEPALPGHSWCELHFQVCYWPQAKVRLRYRGAA